jgi:hypothetical protein
MITSQEMEKGQVVGEEFVDWFNDYTKVSFPPFFCFD